LRWRTSRPARSWRCCCSAPRPVGERSQLLRRRGAASSSSPAWLSSQTARRVSWQQLWASLQRRPRLLVVMAAERSSTSTLAS
jgi:hypothetical protein